MLNIESDALLYQPVVTVVVDSRPPERLLCRHKNNSTTRPETHSFSTLISFFLSFFFFVPSSFLSLFLSPLFTRTNLCSVPTPYLHSSSSSSVDTQRAWKHSMMMCFVWLISSMNLCIRTHVHLPMKCEMAVSNIVHNTIMCIECITYVRILIFSLLPSKW